ncbi:MAG: type II toxin-antitoxin system VapC family toxin [Candidatus Gracilibacteria bacterium]|jgi:predicted nucleic acid-binding protein
MEENKFIVVDASLVLKWFSPEEEDLEQALKLYYRHGEGQFRILVPEHFFVEVSNVFAQKFLDSAESHFSKIKMLGFVGCFIDISIASVAFGLKRKYPKISFYDAAYHALALTKGVPFITADKSYYEMVKNEGNIVLLKDYR